MNGGAIAVAESLRDTVAQITPEEFRWQEANYDRDSPLGRELLFLIANNEWARASAETIDISRYDAVETVIKIDIDLDRITHEVFRERTGRLWLPVAVLPSFEQPARPEPDPFVTLAVTDAGGNLLATLPSAEIRHRISAALAEIIINMAVARWPFPGQQPSATRDQRLLLSAAIYRLLRREQAGLPGEPAGGAPPRSSAYLPRISNARRELVNTLKGYIALLRQDPDRREPPAVQSGRLLTERAIAILGALAESVVVVVAVERDDTPTVLTVRGPSRTLTPVRQVRTWNRHTIWRWLKPGTWNWVLPRAELRVDLLLPSADADRQVEVTLPDGVSFDLSRPRSDCAELEIRVKAPPPLEQLRELMRQLLADPPAWPAPLYQGLADLAAVKADAAREILRDHTVPAGAAGQDDEAGQPCRSGRPGRAAGRTADPAGLAAGSAPSRRVLHQLAELRAALARLSAGGSVAPGLDALARAWGNGDWLPRQLQRRTLADPPSPRGAVARAGMIEDATKRGAPSQARIHVHAAVTDAEYFAIARFSGRMGTLLMSVVLALFVLRSGRLFGISGREVSEEVLAFVLTLFSAIQAGRIERPDLSTLRGRLAQPGSKLIVASVLPTVILAVALAFSLEGTWPIWWAAACIGLQLLLEGLLGLRLRRRRQERAARAASPQAAPCGLVLTTDPPDYGHTEVLHCNWWRSTTAGALMIGRPAYGYLVWQHGAGHSLHELLAGARPAPAPAPSPAAGLTLLSALARDRWHRLQPVRPRPGAGHRPAQPARAEHNGDDPDPPPLLLDRHVNVLAMQRSGTAGQSLTFAVFREKPESGWDEQDGVTQVEIDSGQLAPGEAAVDVIEVFAGLPGGPGLRAVHEHPVTALLAVAAEHRMTVQEVQLPVPAPVPGYTSLRWARMRIALHENDFAAVAPFLSALDQRVRSHRKGHGRTPEGGWITGIRTTSESGPRIIGGTLPPAAARSGPVLAEQLDVVAAAGPLPGESDDTPSWRVLAICADGRSGIGSEILQALSPELRLAGLTYAQLHGKAVLLLLGHQRGGRRGRARSGPVLTRDLPGSNVRVLVDAWQSRADLGTAGRQPMLRVHIRSPDRPGGTLDALDSLNETLQEVAPGALGPGDWNVWYARTDITAGNVGFVTLTLRLDVEPEVVQAWTAAEFDQIESKVRALAARKAAATNNAGDDAGPEEDTVISVKLITLPPPEPPASPGPGPAVPGPRSVTPGPQPEGAAP